VTVYERIRMALNAWSLVIVRVGLLVLLAGELLVTATVQRPDLLHPTAIGTDGSNYYAAGLRLNDGHQLYGPLQPGDRPVPGYPGTYAAPLLSPPMMGVLWRPLALLPGELAMVLWWLGGLLLVTGLTTAFIVAGTRHELAVIGALLFAGVLITFMIGQPYAYPGYYSPISTGALSGNVNAYLVAAFALTWWASCRDRPWVAGSMAALATALKLGPVVLVWWFITQRSWRSVRAFIVAGIALACLGLLLAGVHANVAYLKIALGGVRPTPMSIPGMLHSFLHMPTGIARFGTYVGLAIGLAGVAVLRRHQRASFTVAIITAIFATPVVLPGNLVLLVAAAAPWVATPGSRPLDSADERSVGPDVSSRVGPSDHAPGTA